MATNVIDNLGNLISTIVESMEINHSIEGILTALTTGFNDDKSRKQAIHLMKAQLERYKTQYLPLLEAHEETFPDIKKITSGISHYEEFIKHKKY